MDRLPSLFSSSLRPSSFSPFPSGFSRCDSSHRPPPLESINNHLLKPYPSVSMVKEKIRRQGQKKLLHVSCGTVGSLLSLLLCDMALFERSGLPFLTVCSDILLILIVLLFIRASYAVIRNRQLQELPEFELSEEMVNFAAASFCLKFNNIMIIAHDITLGKDFRLFFKRVVKEKNALADRLKNAEAV